MNLLDAAAAEVERLALTRTTEGFVKGTTQPLGLLAGHGWNLATPCRCTVGDREATVLAALERTAVVVFDGHDHRHLIPAARIELTDEAVWLRTRKAQAEANRRGRAAANATMRARRAAASV